MEVKVVDEEGVFDDSASGDDAVEVVESDRGKPLGLGALGFGDIVEEELGVVLDGREVFDAGRGILASGSARIRNCLCLGTRALLIATAKRVATASAQSPGRPFGAVSEILGELWRE